MSHPIPRTNPTPSARAHTRPRVLLVEDDAEMRAMLEAALVRAGFEVQELPDGERALETLGSLLLGGRSQSGLDLVITDNRMPHFEGLDILEALRMTLEPVPLIMITAFGDPELHERVERQPDAMILDKPFDLEELIEAARRFTTKQGLASTKSFPIDGT